jgi:tetratricopeptide (TPR) repeat protein
LFIIGTAVSGQVVVTDEDRDLEFQERFFEALKHRAIHNYQRALDNLERCQELDSANVAVYFEFAKNYHDLQHYLEAEYFIDKAIALKPGSIPMLNCEVSIYKNQQKFDRAIETQLKLVDINPKYNEELIVLYIQNKQYDKAERRIAEMENQGILTRKIAELKQFIKNRRIPLGNQNKKVETIPPADDVDGLNKQFEENANYQVLLRLLELLLSSRDYDELNEKSTAGLELYPAQPKVYFYKGTALNFLGKYNDAIDVLTIGIDFVINNNLLKASLYDELENAYKGLKEHKKAAESAQKAAVLRDNTE